MKYQPTNWPPSQQPWHQHSPKEIEHRFTVLETEAEAIGEQIDTHDRRLNLHEKAILAMGAVLQIILQDKYPKLAELLKGLLP